MHPTVRSPIAPRLTRGRRYGLAGRNGAGKSTWGPRRWRSSETWGLWPERRLMPRARVDTENHSLPDVHASFAPSVGSQ